MLVDCRVGRLSVGGLSFGGLSFGKLSYLLDCRVGGLSEYGLFRPFDDMIVWIDGYSFTRFILLLPL